MWQTIGSVAAQKLLELSASNENERKSRGAPFADAPRQYCLNRPGGEGPGGNGEGPAGSDGVGSPQAHQRLCVVSNR